VQNEFRLAVDEVADDRIPIPAMARAAPFQLNIEIALQDGKTECGKALALLRGLSAYAWPVVAGPVWF